MRKVIVLTLLALSGCQQSFEGSYQFPPTPPKEYPTVNIPRGLRESNWAPYGEGSCVHASFVMLLRWQGRYHTADYWRKKYHSGEWPSQLAQRMDREGIRYAYTSNKNNVAFLEWACRTRRGCGVTIMGGAHMVCLVHLDDKWAGILDNNDIHKIHWFPRETFLAEWKNSTSWAVTPVYTPMPPLP